MRSLQHFDAKLEIKSMAGVDDMVNMVYIMITLANDFDGNDDGDEGDDGADDG